MHQRAFITVCLLVTVSVSTLVACQQMSQSEVEPASADPLGTIVIPADEPISLGFIASATGEGLSEDAIEFRRGVDLAIAEIGSIGGHEIVIQAARVSCSLQGGQSASAAMLQDETIVSVIGPTCSSACRTTALEVVDKSLTQISPSCGASEFTDATIHNGAFARVMFDDALEGETAADFAFLELGARSAVVVHDSSLEFADRARAFEAAFVEAGGVLSPTLQVDRGLVANPDAVSLILDAEVDVVYVALLADDAAIIVNELAAENSDLPIVGTQMLWTTQFAESVNPDLQTLYAVGPIPIGPALETITGQYSEAYGEPPETSKFAYGYDAAGVILSAIQRLVGDESGELTIGKQALRDQLFETAAFPGGTGVLTCTEWGDCSQASLGVALLKEDGWDTIFLP